MRFGLLLLTLLAIPGIARSDTLTDFHTDVGSAYAAYRTATSYLRTGNAGLASLELSGAVDTWKVLSKKFSKQPPPGFDGDPKFAATMQDIQAALSKGMAASEADDAKTGLAVLDRVRGALYELRRRNGMRLYADCVTELNREMDALYEFRKTPPDFTKPGAGNAIKASAAVYAFLLADCRKLAPAALEADVEFQRLFDGTRASVESLVPATDSGNAGSVVNVLRELRSFDRIIYFRFGG